MLLTSIFPFSPSVFLAFTDKFHQFGDIIFIFCKYLGPVQNLAFW